MPNTIILDNGAHRIKAEYSGAASPRLFPNAITKSKTEKKRVYKADELDECVDKSALYYLLPFERGYLVNWDVEFQIWDRIMGKEVLNVDYQDTRLVLTDPGEIAKAVRDVSSEVVFETYQFDSLLRTSAPSCVAEANYKFDERSSNGCYMVLDSGYSFTHIVPYIQGRIYRNGVVRIDIGGKALTNQLKEWISYRYLNVLDETYVINQCKEDICYVSTNFEKDMKTCSSSYSNFIKRDYILPDFKNLHRGIVQLPSKIVGGEEQTKLCLGVERFSLPEILFRPSNVEINQMGIVEAIAFSLRQIPDVVTPLLLNNIYLIGGNSLFEGYKPRIEADLRSRVSTDLDFNLILPPNPITYAWECAAKLVGDSRFESRHVTRAEFAENGPNICRKRFSNFFTGNL